MGRLRKKEVSMESGRYANKFGACIMNCTHKLACMHTLFLCALAYILAELGQTKDIEVLMESGRYAILFGAHIMAQSHKLVYMHGLNVSL